MAQTVRSASTDSARRRRIRYHDNLYFQDGFWLTAFLVAALLPHPGWRRWMQPGTRRTSVVIPVTAWRLRWSAHVAEPFDGFALSSQHVRRAGGSASPWRAVPADQVSPTADEIEHQRAAGARSLRAATPARLVDAAVSRTASADNYVFIFEICFLVRWLTHSASGRSFGTAPGAP